MNSNETGLERRHDVVVHTIAYVGDLAGRPAAGPDNALEELAPRLTDTQPCGAREHVGW